MSHRSREIQLVARPQGEPSLSDFGSVEVEVPDPGPAEVLVRNRWMSVDPYMRGRMNDVRSYVPPFSLDAPLEGGAVGEVIESRTDAVPVGALVLHNLGWRELATVSADAVRVLDAEQAPAEAYLGVLGMPGLTAWVGLLTIAGLREGDTVFVSGAAGAVGSLVGQIARLRGHQVIGSAGSAEKVAFLREQLGFDAAFDYHDGDVATLLGAAAPKGIDVYFDNVGGEHLEAALGALRPHGRVALCGAISQYNATEPPPGPRNLTQVIGKRLTLRGFIVTDHADQLGPFISEVGGWLRDGRLHHPQTVVDGLENAPGAFIGLLQGQNTGKMLVRLA